MAEDFKETSFVVDTQCKCGLWGAVQAVAEIEGVLPIIHGPIGCSFLITCNFSQSYGKEITLFSTDVGYEDVIYGARDRLKEGIIKADNLYKPEVILVLSSCVSDTIGEDIEGIVGASQPHVASKLLAIACGGYKMKEPEAFSKTLCLMTSLMEDRDKDEGKSINLLGFTGAGLYGRANLQEVRRLLAKCSVEVRLALAGEAKMEDIKKAPSVDLNVVVSESRGLNMAKIMEEKFGIPYIVKELPVGFDTTYQWLLDVTKNLGLEKEKEINEEKKEAEKTLLVNSRRYFTWYGTTFNNLEAAILGEFDYVHPLIQFLCEELGLKARIVGLDNASEKETVRLKEKLSSLEYQSHILLNPSLPQLEKLFQEVPIDIIFGSSLHSFVAKRAYGKPVPVVKVSHPIYDEIRMLPVPIIGFNGALALCEMTLNKIYANFPLMSRDILFTSQFGY